MSKPSRGRYRKADWSGQTASTCRRGSLLIWLDKEMTWLASPDGGPGRPAAFLEAPIQFPSDDQGAVQAAEHMRDAIDALPPAQRAVMVLRVQQGLDASEVCAALGLSDGNMRVLLHRARLSLRATLDALS